VRFAGSDGSFGNRSYWLAIIFFMLAGFSKSAAAALPLTMLAIDVWIKRPFSARIVLEKIPFFAIAAGFGALTIYSRLEGGYADNPGNFDLLDRILMVSHTILFYWTKLLVPFGYSIWYPFIKDNGVWPWTYYAAPIVLAGIIFLAWRVRRQAPFFWYGLLFYLANIVLELPYSTFGNFELRSDRYNYLACLGIFIILASLPDFLKARKDNYSGASWAALGLLGVICFFSTAFRIRDWHDTMTLVTKAIEATGDNFGRAYLWRGMELGDKGKPALALQDFNKALSINPNLIEAYKYRGALLGAAKKFDRSIADLNIYLEKFPNDAEYHYDRGLSYLNLNRLQEGLADFDMTLKLNPNFERAYRARGNTYEMLGDKVKADQDLREWERRTGRSRSEQ
jgi:tetratricopeptide (TPR) repeat protein